MATIKPNVGTRRAKDLDHADHSAQQAQQGRGAGDGAQWAEVALHLVHGVAAR